MENKNESMGKRIERLMRQNNLSQRELADYSEVTPAALCHYIKDERVPRPDILKNIATALETTVDYLLTGKYEEVEFNRARSILTRCRTNLSSEQKIELIKILSK